MHTGRTNDVRYIFLLLAMSSGNIPKELSRLTALRVLRLGTNRLSGESRCFVSTIYTVLPTTTDGRNLRPTAVAGVDGRPGELFLFPPRLPTLPFC